MNVGGKLIGLRFEAQHVLDGSIQ